MAPIQELISNIGSEVAYMLTCDNSASDGRLSGTSTDSTSLERRDKQLHTSKKKTVNLLNLLSTQVQPQTSLGASPYPN